MKFWIPNILKTWKKKNKITKKWTKNNGKKYLKKNKMMIPQEKYLQKKILIEFWMIKKKRKKDGTKGGIKLKKLLLITKKDIIKLTTKFLKISKLIG